MFEEVRESVLRTCTDLVTNGVVRNTGSAGNVSVRPAGTDNRIVITPSKTNYDTMDPEDMLVVDGSGSIIESPSGYDPSSETPMHLNVHEVVDDSRAVVHSHPKNAIALGAITDSIPTIHVDQAYFVGDHVPVIEYVPSGSEEMGREVSDAIQDAGAVLIRHHGLITIGGDLSEALERTLAIESNASIYHRTATLDDVPSMDNVHIQQLQDPGAEL